MGSGISSHFGKKSKNRQLPPTTIVDGPTSFPTTANDRPYIVPLDLPPVISTPRNIQFISDLEGKKICVPYTPVGSEALVFKYYCPLCMRFFKDIMKGDCCGNYICIECFNDYLESKGIDKCFTKDTEMIIQSGILEDITCPHCVHYGFQISFVSDCDEVRDYSRNVPLLKLENSSTGSSKNNLPLPSPLRVGESFEDLKRKMVPYKLQNKLQSVASESRIDETVSHVSPRMDSFSAHGSPKPEDENNLQHLPDPISLFHDRGQITTAVPSTDTVPSSEDEAAARDRGTGTHREVVAAAAADGRAERSPLHSPITVATSAIADGAGDFDSDELSEATPLPVRNPSSERQGSSSQSQSQLYELSSFSLNIEHSMSEIRAIVVPHTATSQHTQVVEAIREEQ